MKAAVLNADKALEIIEREDPCCGPYDVIVAVEVCGVCRTDRKAFQRGQRDLVTPRVLGHEIAGRVREAGSEVTSFQPGDRVQVYPGIACGTCEYCAAGLDHLCDQMQIIGFHVDGGFTELLWLRGEGSEPRNLSRIPDSLDARTASLAEPLACSLNIQKRLELNRAHTVLIFGAGPLGILSAQLARTLGAEKIVIVEPMKSRRLTAAQFSDFQLDFDGQTAECLMELSHGRGVDVILPCCPDDAPFLMGLQVAAKRGRLGFFSGLTSDTALTCAEINVAHYREITIQGGYGCSSEDNREALSLLASGVITREGVPSREVSWQELPDNLSLVEPYEQVFTFFDPHSHKANHKETQK